jgi:hypothetical protein
MKIGCMMTRERAVWKSPIQSPQIPRITAFEETRIGISGTGYETPKRQRLSDWGLRSLSLKLSLKLFSAIPAFRAARARQKGCKT